MVELPVGIVLAMGAGALWFAGLRLFLRSSLSPARKLGWTTLLVMAGISIGVLLSFGQLGIRFVVLILILPALGLADVALFRSGRGLSFWIRACGFEVCSVFGVAFAARFLLDWAGVPPLLGAPH